jgi:hypothetical protein
MSSRRTVHIPIVQPGGARAGLEGIEDRLIEVYTQHYAFDPLTKQEEALSREVDARARDKDWDRVAAPLRKVGLYQAGCAAASAVRKLGIRQPLTALYQRISRFAWIEGQRLQPASPSGPSEGRSAELGLALVLLMCASGSRHRHVIATGALGGQPRGVSNDDVEVLPVGSLREKLRLVLTFARHGGLPAPGPGRELLFITPRQFEQDGLWSDVPSLPEIGQLREFGVRVVPVGRLSEAAAEMKALRARHLVHDRLAQVLVASALLLGVMGYGWWSLRETHIPMVFLPGGGAALDAEPFQACFTADGGFYPIPLARNGVGRQVPVGETLGWRVQVGESQTSRSGLTSWLAPEHYYLAQVMVSERSRAKIKVPKQSDADDFMVSPGGVWEWAWELNDQPENNGLVLLARPGSPFDPEALRAELLEKFPAANGGGEPTGLDVTAAVNFIASQAPGAATFVLQTVEGSVSCNG